MNSYLVPLQFAQSYGSGQSYGSNQPYGTSTYSSSTYSSNQASTGSGTTANNGALVDTGFIVAIVVTVAALTIFISLIVRIWKRPRKQTVANSKTPTTPSAKPKK